ncbi:hypothetical protein [Acuticoccus mangrovi]|uniref:Uncharacterized protein n=1 Tax=Acuticoccus mangrovi TaxID=2796142 RepID=A0A934MMV8_9HYPH|nr:hypothetical protein [Acuticoccus mangrovi]MBJ3777629.1 hypothetical protein [Acuticoccus mangrovi]
MKRTDVVRALLAATSIAAFLHVVLPFPFLGDAAAVALCGVIVSGAPGLRRGTAILCAVLSLVTIGALVAGASPAALWHQLIGAAMIAAFFHCLVVLRATVENHPRLPEVKQRFSAIADGAGDGGIVLMNHILGGVISVGTFTIFAPIVADADEPHRRRMAELCLRGMASIVLWSPLSVAMVTVTSKLPQMPLWSVVLVGMTIAFSTFAIQSIAGVYSLKGSVLKAVINAIMPLFGPMLILILAIFLAVGVTGASAIAAMIVCVPAFALLWATRWGQRAPRQVLRGAYLAGNVLVNDVALFTASLVTAGVLVDLLGAPDAVGAAGGTSHLSFLMIAAAASTVALLPLAGIHMVLPATIVLSFLGTQADLATQLALGTLVMTAWAVASMSSIGSISMLSASSLFRVSRKELLLGSNALVTALTVAVALTVAGLIFVTAGIFAPDA